MPDADDQPAASTVQLGYLVQALSRAETADEMARVIAEAGAMSAGAEFANIATANHGAGRSAIANLYHASSLVEEVAQRYMTWRRNTRMPTTCSSAPATRPGWRCRCAAVGARWAS